MLIHLVRKDFLIVKKYVFLMFAVCVFIPPFMMWRIDDATYVGSMSFILAAIFSVFMLLQYVPYKIGKLQIQGFSEPTTPNKIKQSYHITQKAARSRPRAAFLRGKLGRRQDFSKK